MSSAIPPRPGDGWSFNPPPGWTVPEGWEPPADWDGPDPEWPAAPPYWLWWKEPSRPTPVLPTAIAPLEKNDPARIGGYRLVGRLGSGGMGVVYAGVDPGGRRVAVKVVHPAFAGDSEFRARFARETAVLGRVTGACIAQVVAADTTTDKPWLATEYVSGPTLDAYIRDHGPLSGDSLYGVAAGLAEAIVAIHSAGVVHRDLKPANVILSPDGPRVVDFGIARALDETAMTRTGVIVGSPGWISPEEYHGDEAGPAADVYNWGLLVTYAASGTLPFGIGRPEVLASRVTRSKVDTSAVPENLRDLVDQALAKIPEDRPDATTVLNGTVDLWRAEKGATTLDGDNPAKNATMLLGETWAIPSIRETAWLQAGRRTGNKRMIFAIGALASALTVIAAATFADGTNHTNSGNSISESIQPSRVSRSGSPSKPPTSTPSALSTHTSPPTATDGNFKGIRLRVPGGWKLRQVNANTACIESPHSRGTSGPWKMDCRPDAMLIQTNVGPDEWPADRMDGGNYLLAAHYAPCLENGRVAKARDVESMDNFDEAYAHFGNFIYYQIAEDASLIDSGLKRLSDGRRAKYAEWYISCTAFNYNMKIWYLPKSKVIFYVHSTHILDEKGYDQIISSANLSGY